MPLHLLGKKSWNVYNTASIERVRRDEAQAQAREEAAEQRMQEEDAQRRIALLRGEDVAPLPPSDEPQIEDPQHWRETRPDDTYAQRDLKRKRRRGEDDTDRDIRYARQDHTSAGERKTRELLNTKDREAPLEDHAGHIQLIPAPDETTIRKAEKNAEAEAEKAKRRKRDEDQYTMRFSNAAGFQNGMQKPWYAASSKDTPKTAPSSTDLVLADVQQKDVWGNEDPRRKEREQNRILSSDPFAAMQQAQRQLKQSEKDRESWERKQKAEMEEMRREQKRERQSRRRRREGDEDSLEGFSLDAPAKGDREGSRHDRHRRHRHHHRRRRGSRSRSRGRDQDGRHTHRHRQRDEDR